MGAIGGLAEQPLQSVHNSNSLFTGVGKGLIGLVTKPVGAVAELVNQTGQGLLRITGVNRIPTSQLRLQRCPLNKEFSRFSISPTKCLSKFIQTNDSNSSGIILNAIIEAVNTDDEIKQAGQSSSTHQPYNLTGCYLTLTEDVLYIIDKNDDMLLRAFYLAQIDLSTAPDNASLLIVTLHSQKVEKFTNEYEKIYESTIDRLVEYIKVHSAKSNKQPPALNSDFFLDSVTTTTSSFYYQFSKIDILNYLDYYDGLPCSCGAVLTSLKLLKSKIEEPKTTPPINNASMPNLLERISLDLTKQLNLKDDEKDNRRINDENILPRIHRIQSIDKFGLKTSLASSALEEDEEGRNLSECQVSTQQQRHKFFYYVDPRMSTGFVSVFNCLKRKLVNKGFQY